MTRTARTAPQELPGQLALPLEVPELADDQRAELTAHVQPNWQRMAECRSTGDDTWFPETGQPALNVAAVERCTFCPVRSSCLAHALSEGEEYGIWGGTTETQRAALLIDLADSVSVTDVLDSATIRPAYLWRQSA